MKKTQSRIAKAVVKDFEALSKTLSKKAEIMKTLSKKYDISTKTVQRILKKDNVLDNKDNVLDNNLESFFTKVDQQMNNIPSSGYSIPANGHKYRIKSTGAHLVFEDENGREIRGDSDKDYGEWKVAYERAVDSGAILF